MTGANGGDEISEQALQRLLAMAADDDPERDRPDLPPRYEIRRELGRGGMGVVYEVFDRQLGRSCALKTLGAGAGADGELRRRLAREASAAARLRHAHIAAVYDATPEFITMQLVDGGPIGGPIGGGPVGTAPGLDRRLAVELVRDAALALQHAHEHGIVHRDLKPSNLLVEGRHVFVVDFGLAKTIDAASSLSLSGAVVGTPAFMPPEQALGRTDLIDARSDVYGLGATLWYCLGGAPPFTAPDLPALLRAVVEDDARPIAGDRDLDLVLGKCLAKERDHRYASARELADDLDRWLRDEPVLARPPSRVWRLQKRLRRQRALWRAAALAIAVTALVLVPMWLRESAAHQAANEAVELADHVATVIQDAALLLELGDQDAARQRLDGGITEARGFLARHEVARVRYLLARMLQLASRHSAARQELDRALALAPDLADARIERGLLLAALPEPSAAERSQAIADLGAEVQDRSVQDRSVLRDVDRLFAKAERLRLQGDSRRAMELLREVLEYDGMHLPARLSLAAAARDVGENTLSIYYSASVMDLQMGYGHFYLARERHALRTSVLGLDGLLVDFADHLRDSPGSALGLAHRGIVQLRRALRLADEQRLAEAVSAVQGAIADHDTLLLPHNDTTTGHHHLPGALNNRAVCRLTAEQLHRSTGNTTAAVAERRAAAEDLAEALRLEPTLPAAHFNIGVIARRECELLRAMGRSELAATAARAAIAAFDRALAMAPERWPHTELVRRQRDQVQAGQ
jgi:tetratricopeptide (TPR) repeat protein